jgi:hypothetical protein
VASVAAQLLLFAKLSENDDCTIPPKVVAVVQSLSQFDPQPDSLLTFALGDNIDHNPIVVDVTTIASTAFVLPCVKSPTDEFPVDVEKATYFLVMPPRVEWKNIGWE